MSKSTKVKVDKLSDGCEPWYLTKDLWSITSFACLKNYTVNYVVSLVLNSFKRITCRNIKLANILLKHEFEYVPNH